MAKTHKHQPTLVSCDPTHDPSHSLLLHFSFPYRLRHAVKAVEREVVAHTLPQSILCLSMAVDAHIETLQDTGTCSTRCWVSGQQKISCLWHVVVHVPSMLPLFLHPLLLCSNPSLLLPPPPPLSSSLPPSLSPLPPPPLFHLSSSLTCCMR